MLKMLVMVSIVDDMFGHKTTCFMNGIDVLLNGVIQTKLDFHIFKIIVIVFLKTNKFGLLLFLL